jgi:hypothetical protein
MITYLIVFIILFSLLLIALRVGRRSGVDTNDLKRSLPGDSIIIAPAYVADRATLINAPAEEVWPWIVQLGKGRAGWYSPVWLERLLVWNPKKRGARTLLPQFQALKTGDVVADWGPGSLEVLDIKTGSYLLYGSIKPGDDIGNYLFSWVHMLEKIDDTSCRLHTRLRIRSANPVFNAFALFGGVFDWATIVIMYSGLKYNLRTKIR